MSHPSDFHYQLPDELIAQVPLPSRSDSRLLVLREQNISHGAVRDLPSLLKPGDRLIFNDTRVVPARLYGEKATGGKLEIMLERVTEAGTVLVKIRSSRSPNPGSLITLAGGQGETTQARVCARHDDLFELSDPDNRHERLAAFFASHGEIPLPPYINRKPDDSDQERYQTVFAEKPGAVAAPTAGLHFDRQLLDELEHAGIERSFITLHVGAGTFQPVRVDDINQHVMHAERVEVPQLAVDEILETKSRGGRVIAVGTTCVRSLEAAAAQTSELQSFQGETQLFITSGYRFRLVDGIITNFHLPESTLLMLIAAFAGLDNTLSAYRAAVEQRYRFFSYGDAMLVWPQRGGMS